VCHGWLVQPCRPSYRFAIDDFSRRSYRLLTDARVWMTDIKLSARLGKPAVAHEATCSVDLVLDVEEHV
jgi:hypothetical protein